MHWNLRTNLIVSASVFILLLLASGLAFSGWVAQVGPEPVEPVALLPGLEYAYYEIDASLDSQRPVETGTVPNFDISLNARDTNYAFEFTGYLQITTTNLYTFMVESNNTVRVVIGGQVVVTHPGLDEPTNRTIELREGYHALRVDYAHVDQPMPNLAISWQSVALAQQPLPDSVLFRDDPATAPTATLEPSPTVTSTPMSPGSGTTTFLPTSTPTASPDQTVDENEASIYVPSLLLPPVTEPLVFLTNLSDNESVTNPFLVEMGAINFEVEPAGSPREGAGHFHLMIDVPCVEPGKQIPNDDNHIHYGSGDTSTILELSAGSHTLCLQAGDGVHTALALTDTVTIIVADQDTEPKVSFAAPASGTVLNGDVDVVMIAENFIIEPAGGEIPGRGHFHIMVDTPCIGPGNLIPRDESHLHFGQGQTEATLTLSPGVHTLCLQAGTGFHNALPLTEIVTITVQPEPQVAFIQPRNGDTVTTSVSVEMDAVNFTIEPAGNVNDGAGHFHIMVDVPCVEVGLSIPADDSHLHYGAGQSSTTLQLEPGYHILCLQAGNGIHTALPLTDTVEITVSPAVDLGR